MLSKVLIQITNNKFGVEIGGPSPENIIYENAIFSKDTIWACHEEEYNYYKNKKGKVIIMIL